MCALLNESGIVWESGLESFVALASQCSQDCQEAEHLDELQSSQGRRKISTLAGLPADSGALLPNSLQVERRRRQSQPQRPLLMPLMR